MTTSPPRPPMSRVHQVSRSFSVIAIVRFSDAGEEIAAMLSAPKCPSIQLANFLPDIIKCFRGWHRGGCSFTSFLPFSRPFFSVQQNEPSRPSNLHPPEGNPLKHRLKKTCGLAGDGDVRDRKTRRLRLRFLVLTPRPLLTPFTPLNPLATSARLYLSIESRRSRMGEGFFVAYSCL